MLLSPALPLPRSIVGGSVVGGLFRSLAKASWAKALLPSPWCRMREVEVAGYPVLLVREGLDLRALGGRCPHAGAPLCKGEPPPHCAASSGLGRREGGVTLRKGPGLGALDPGSAHGEGLLPSSPAPWWASWRGLGLQEQHSHPLRPFTGLAAKGWCPQLPLFNSGSLGCLWAHRVPKISQWTLPPPPPHGSLFLGFRLLGKGPAALPLAWCLLQHQDWRH